MYQNVKTISRDANVAVRVRYTDQSSKSAKKEAQGTSCLNKFEVVTKMS